MRSEDEDEDEDGDEDGDEDADEDGDEEEELCGPMGMEEKNFWGKTRDRRGDWLGGKWWGRRTREEEEDWVKTILGEFGSDEVGKREEEVGGSWEEGGRGTKEER